VRVVVLGATGNVGTSLLQALAGDEQVDEVVGVARRKPRLSPPKTTWVAADVSRDPLADHLRGADVVVHLAWLIQPSRDLPTLWATNVEGSARIFDAVAEAGVRNLVYASSVGAYSPGPKDRLVDESWPTHGVARSSYSREKAYVERLLDAFELEHPDVRVVRLRPGLIFKREAASEVRRYFFGTLFPNRLLRRGLLPVFPRLPGVRFQALHSLDAGEAYRLAVTREVHGAFNLAADPVLALDDIAELLDARTIPVPRAVAPPAAAATWRLRLHPVEPGWVDLALNAPLMDTTRARQELGWAPRHTSREAVGELLEGIRQGAGDDTPVLRPDAERSRLREVRTGQGESGGLGTQPGAGR
jgi:UDP-glucose 4-epimerase